MKHIQLKQSLTEKALKVAAHLWQNGYKGCVFFDRSSYDQNTDIPRYINEGVEYDVRQLAISEDGKELSLAFAPGYSYSGVTIDLPRFDASVSEEGFEQDCADSVMNLLAEAYWQTKESSEMDDDIF